MGIYPKRISGDVVVQDGADSSAPKVTVTIYVTQGRKRSPPINVGPLPGDTVESLIQATAEGALYQVNPYVLAVHFYNETRYKCAIQICAGTKCEPCHAPENKRGS